MGVHHRLGAAGDQIALRQDVVHALPLSHAVTGRRHVELGGDAARGPDAFFDEIRKLFQRPMPRVDVSVRIDDADHRLVQILDAIAAGIHQPHPIGFLRIVRVASFPLSHLRSPFLFRKRAKAPAPFVSIIERSSLKEKQYLTLFITSKNLPSSDRSGSIVKKRAERAEQSSAAR